MYRYIICIRPGTGNVGSAMTILRRVKNYMQEQRLISPGAIVLAAVSGGVDSMVMADLLLQLRQELCFELAIANFNHGLRPEAAEEAALVRDWAARNGVACFCGGADIAQLAQGKNTQDVARRERYAFLRSTAYKLGQALIATAHHRDDQAETVLMRLLRGSGPAGLAAMSPAENGVIRPLLCLTRAEIADYAVRQGIDYRDDASNFSTKYLRNRIRLELLPLLREYNPQIVDTLCSTADICREEDILMDDLAENALAELWNAEDLCLDGTGFDRLPLSLQRRVLRKAFCLLAGDMPELSFDQSAAVLALREEQSAALPHGMKAYRRGDIFFADEMPPLDVIEEMIPLTADGEWHQMAAMGHAYVACLGEAQPLCPPDMCCVPVELADSLVWRTRREGDRVPSNGQSGCRKLKDIFIDAKIPPHRRNRWPLLAAGEDILWVTGLWRREYARAGKSILIKIRDYDNIL